jgi:hypothetical protein
MRDYRIYFLDDAGGFCDIQELRAHTDKDALELAEGVRHGRAAELWHGPSLIGRFSSDTRRDGETSVSKLIPSGRRPS